MSLIDKRHKLIKEWIEAAAEKIKNTSDYDVKEKESHSDLVTNLDKDIEKFLTDKIHTYFPSDKIVSEEGFGDKVDKLNGTVWFIDPIDGTLNFVKQNKNYCIMVALYQNGVGVQSYIYDLFEDALYWAIKGQGAYRNAVKLKKLSPISYKDGLIASNSKLATNIASQGINEILSESLGVRMIGSAGLEAVEVAQGNLTAYVASQLKPWDFAPGKIIVEEVGGMVSTLTGNELDLLEVSSVLIACPKASEEIIKVLKTSFI